MESRYLKSLPYFLLVMLILFLTIDNKELLSILVICAVVAWFVIDYYLYNKSNKENK
jgi:uncharacterized membrane protein YhaH (DUF805 family)